MRRLAFASSSTVYGPMGRPDMACFKFADTLRAGGSIQFYDMGGCRHDCTHVDDIAESVLPEGYDFDAHKELVPMVPGDVVDAFAGCS